MFILTVFILGLLLVALAAFAWDRLVFSRLFDDPLLTRALAMPAAWLTCGGAVVLLVGPEALSFELFLVWLVPASFVAVWFVHGGYRLRQARRDVTGIAREFE